MALIIILLSICLTAIIVYLNNNWSYWKKKKVPYIKPVPFFGNFKDYILLKKFYGQVAQEICQQYPNEPYIGTFYGTEPALLIQDPELIKQIMTKDFYYFNSREIANYTHKETTTQNLFFTYGDRWKVLRQNLTPLFTSTKMKNMFHLIQNCCLVFEKMLDNEFSKCNVVETRTLAARFTMDVIGSCAFGVNTNTMDKSENNVFTAIGNMILDSSTSRAIKWISRSIWPALFYGFRFQFFPKEVDVFFKDLLVNVFEGRQFKPSNRNDFIDLVLSLKTNKCISGDSINNLKTGDSKKVEIEVDDELLVSNCVAFFAAGYETSATTMSFTLYEIAKDRNAQRKMQEEIDKYLSERDNQVKFDCITDLKYTEACVDEALRLYPVLGVISRELVEDHTLSTGLCLKKGMRIHLPVYHMQRNPEYYPEPNEFRPERFLPENKSQIKQYTYMPFGEGPRICIGMRFAKMQMMAGLVTILKKYNVELAEGTPSTLMINPRAIITQPLGGIYLKFTVREGWESRQYAK